MKRERKYNSLKKCLLLCILIFCTVLFSGVPASAEVRNEIGWWRELGSSIAPTDTKAIQIEVGEQFNLGYYFMDFTFDNVKYTVAYRYGTELNLTYKSSEPAVAAVGARSGIVKGRKAGKSQISFTYKGKNYTCFVTVKKKNALKVGTVYKKLNQAAKGLAKYEGKKITSGNVAALARKDVAYQNELNKFSQNPKQYPVYGMVGTKLVNPYDRICAELSASVGQYIEKHMPEFVIAKASGKADSDEITVQLKKAPTERDVCFEQWSKALAGQESPSPTTVELEVSVSGDADCTGICTIEEGSKTATVQLRDWDGNEVYLQKGGVYKISIEGGKAKQFKAK